MNRSIRAGIVTAALAAVMLLPTSAMASIALTGEAYNPRSTGVLLKGTAAPLVSGEVSETYFEWGTSTSYGNKTTPETNATVQRSTQVKSELKVGQTYHYRFVSGTGSGQQGQNRTFVVRPAFEAETAASLSGAAKGEFSIDLGHGNSSITCKMAGLSGYLGKSALSFNTDPTIADCHLLGYGLNGLQFLANGCQFRFNEPTELVSVGGPFKGTMDIVNCSPEMKFSVFPTYCQLTIPNQSGLGPITYTTTGSGSNRKVEASIAAQNLTYKCAGKTWSDATFTGTWLIAGSAGGKQTGFWVQ